MSPLKNNYLTLRSKVKVPQRSLRYATHRLMVMHPHTKYHWTIWKDKKSYGPDKLRWEEAEATEEEKIRLKQYVSLRSKGRQNNRIRQTLFFFSNLAFIFRQRLSKYTCIPSNGTNSIFGFHRIILNSELV